MPVPDPEPSQTPAAAAARADRLTAVALMCGAVVTFSMLDATAKYLVGVKGVPVLEVVWVRFAVHALLTVLVLGPMAVPRLARAAKPAHQMLRGLFMLGATVFNFTAVRYLQLDQTVTIFFLTPLVVAALAGPLLGEWVGWRRLLAIVTGFLGVLLVTRPGFGGIHWAVLFSFGATACYSLYNIYTRYLAAHDTTEVTQFYTPLTALALTFPFAASVWQWPEDPFVWVLFAVLGVTGGGGHFLLILAHRRAPAPILAPFVYIGIISMTIMGYLVFGDLPTVWTLAGGAVVTGSGLYLAYRERRAGTAARRV